MILSKSATNSVIVDIKVSCEIIDGQSKDTKCLNYAFKGSTETLTTVNFPVGSRLKTINDCAFYACQKLQAVDFTNCQYLTFIGKYAFYNCINIASITLPPNLQSLESGTFFTNEKITSIVIPSTVRSIGLECFKNCRNLQYVTIPEDSILQTMDTYAFGFTNVQTLNLPRTITDFKSDAAAGNPVLRYISIPNSNENYVSDNGVLYSKDMTAIILVPPAYASTFSFPSTIKTVGYSSFYQFQGNSIIMNEGITKLGEWSISRSLISSINLPNSLVTIGSYAFYGCVRLAAINFGNSLKSIGDSSFYSTAVLEINLPEGLTTIYANAFANCKNLTSIYIPSTVSSIGGGIMSGTNITSIVFGSGSNYSLDTQKLLFDNTKQNLIQYLGDLENITIPNTVITIRSSAFENLKIKNIKFEKNSVIKSIETNAFRNCILLESIEFPSTLEQIWSSAFQNCIKLQQVHFPSKLIWIDKNGFYSCTSLTSVIFDAHEQGKFCDLYEGAFQKCVNLVNLQMNYGIRMINDYCFASCSNLESVSFPSSVSSIGIYSFLGTKIKSVIFDQQCMIQRLESFAFTGAVYLETIKLPDNVQSLGDNVFQSTKLSEFIVPKSVVNISAYCFMDCSLLKTFTIPEDCNLQIIGFGCFQGCKNLSSFVCQDTRYFEVDNGALFNRGRSNLICFPPASRIRHFCFSQNINRIASCAFLDCANIESIAIPDDSVVSIGAQAFANCINLKSINIPLSVTSVDADAFLGCKNLKCGVLIDNKNPDFIKNLIKISGLSYTATKECGIITCFQRVTDISRMYYSSILVFILM